MRKFMGTVDLHQIALPIGQMAIFVVGAMHSAMAGGALGGNLLLLKALSLVANVVPYLLILFTAERKGLHDMISRTVVVKVDR